MLLHSQALLILAKLLLWVGWGCPLLSLTLNHMVRLCLNLRNLLLMLLRRNVEGLIIESLGTNVGFLLLLMLLLLLGVKFEGILRHRWLVMRSETTDGSGLRLLGFHIHF